MENSAVVKGGDENKQDIIKRFAPEASGYQQTLAESDETELQYVVATDTLSEGVNLQDISVVVNYDLPWNPMRIVQRVGRIDRIGSTADKYVHNFYPDGDIEAAIKLQSACRRKSTISHLLSAKRITSLIRTKMRCWRGRGSRRRRRLGNWRLKRSSRQFESPVM